MKKGNTSTQTLLGVKHFSRNGVQTAGHGELAYFLVTPTNISVLSRVSIAQNFGLDTSTRVNIMSAVHTTTTAINLTRAIAKK